jgi:hypothetical protein
MTEQEELYPGYVTQMKHGMKHYLNWTLKKFRRTFQILNFYTLGFKRHLLAMGIFSILLGLMETFQIILLYTILNASFDIQGECIRLCKQFAVNSRMP